MTDRWSEADLADLLKRQNAKMAAAKKTPVAPVVTAGTARKAPRTRRVPSTAGAPEAPRPSKYGNRATVGPNGQGGERPYSSKREQKHAVSLTTDKSNGTIADFYPQISLEIGRDEEGAAVRAVIDFLVIEEWLPDGRFVARLDDPKGADTLLSKTKRAALDARGMTVRLI